MAIESPATSTLRSRTDAVRIIRRILITIAVVVAAVYAAAVLYIVSQETQLIFAAGRPLAEARPEGPFEQIDLPRADGQRQFAWILPHPSGPAAAPWMIFLHGKRATVASRVNIVRYEAFRALGMNVIAPEYRGFAGLEGIPSEGSVAADARAAYDYVRNTLGVPAGRMVIFGWSLGSAVAVNLAADARAAAVILEGAPASIVAIGERNYPWLPVRLLIRNPFESILKVTRIDAPMLFLHSPEDVVIPIEEARRLFAAAIGPKAFVELRGGHIAPAEVDTTKYVEAVAEFLSEHGILYRGAESGLRAPVVQ